MEVGRAEPHGLQWRGRRAVLTTCSVSCRGSPLGCPAGTARAASPRPTSARSQSQTLLRLLVGREQSWQESGDRSGHVRATDARAPRHWVEHAGFRRVSSGHAAFAYGTQVLCNPSHRIRLVWEWECAAINSCAARIGSARRWFQRVGLARGMRPSGLRVTNSPRVLERSNP